MDEIPRKVVIKRWMNEMRTKIMGHIREPADVCLSFNTLRKTTFGRRYITYRRTQYVIENVLVFQSKFMSLMASRSTQLFIDGTFQCCPRAYKQILVILTYDIANDM